MPETTVHTAAGPIRAYLAVPAVGAGPWPGVVVVHDALGLGDVAREHALHLAAAGYVVLVPDLYARGGLRRCVKATFTAMASGQGQAYDDIEAARRALVDRDHCTGRVGVIGFCMGGGFALMTASRRFQVAAPNYGPLPKDLDAALGGACPIVASYGAKDRGLRGAAAILERGLSERGIAHDVKEYGDAGHSFMDRFNAGPLAPLLRVSGVGYHQPSAEDAWGRILAFFAEHLASAGGEAAG